MLASLTDLEIDIMMRKFVGIKTLVFDVVAKETKYNYITRQTIKREIHRVGVLECGHYKRLTSLVLKKKRVDCVYCDFENGNFRYYTDADDKRRCLYYANENKTELCDLEPWTV